MQSVTTCHRLANTLAALILLLLSLDNQSEVLKNASLLTMWSLSYAGGPIQCSAQDLHSINLFAWLFAGLPNITHIPSQQDCRNSWGLWRASAKYAVKPYGRHACHFWWPRPWSYRPCGLLERPCLASIEHTVQDRIRFKKNIMVTLDFIEVEALECDISWAEAILQSHNARIKESSSCLLCVHLPTEDSDGSGRLIIDRAKSGPPSKGNSPAHRPVSH